jgi:hypothetical protein
MTGDSWSAINHASSATGYRRFAFRAMGKNVCKKDGV